MDAYDVSNPFPVKLLVLSGHDLGSLMSEDSDPSCYSVNSLVLPPFTRSVLG